MRSDDSNRRNTKYLNDFVIYLFSIFQYLFFPLPICLFLSLAQNSNTLGTNAPRQALEQQEMFAIYPLKSCPHLRLLRPEEAPKCKRTSHPEHL